MKWFRSAEMEYVSITFEEDISHEVISELGRLSSFQFTDVFFNLILVKFCNNTIPKKICNLCKKM